MRSRSSTVNVHCRAPVVFALVALCLAMPQPVSWAATYYVDGDNPNARDNNPGTESLPWKTIGRATPLLEPGDTLLVKAGTYRETVILSRSGKAPYTSGRTGKTSDPVPITIMAYPGHEGKAIINAAEPVVHWRKCALEECAGNRHWSHIYSADVADLVQSHPDSTFAIRQVFQHGKLLNRSRYPDAGWRYPASYSNAPRGPRTIFCEDLPPRDGYFTGSVCHIKTARWQLEQIPVVASVASEITVGTNPPRIMPGCTLTLATAPRYEISWRYGFYLTNLVGEINEEGEWAYDAAQKKLFLWPKGDKPENVEVSYRQYCLRSNDGTSWNVVRGLAMHNAYQDGIWLYQSHDMTVEDNTVEHSYAVGLYVHTLASARNQIARNTVKYSCFRGMVIDGADHNVEANYVYATGTDSFAGDLMNGAIHNAIVAGLYIHGPRIRVYNNRIDRTAYTSLYLDGPTEGRDISYNHMTNSNLSLSDGACIYMAGYSDTPEKDHIHHNILTDAIGCLTMDRAYDRGLPPTLETYSGDASGIYVDEEGNNRIIEHNTIIDSGMAGIFFHQATTNVVQNNTLYGNRVAQVYLVGRNQPNRTLVDDILLDNILFTTDDGQRTLYVTVYYEDVRLGQSDRNYFYNPYNSAHIHVDRQNSSGKWIEEDLALDGWRTLSGYDGSSWEFSHLSQLDGITLRSPTRSEIVYNASLDTITVDLEPEKYCDVQGNRIHGSVTLEPFESKVLISADF